MLKNIVLIEQEELNPMVDSRRACNGGGYSQPRKVFSFERNGKPYTLTYTDTNCGEFGTRYSISVKNKDEKEIYRHYCDSTVGIRTEDMDKEFTADFFWDLHKEFSGTRTKAFFLLGDLIKKL